MAEIENKEEIEKTKSTNMSGIYHMEQFDVRFPEKWTRYNQRMDLFFVANGITEELRMQAVFLTTCGAKVYDLVCSLVAPKAVSEMKTSELKKILNDHFSPAPSEIAGYYKFHKRDQHPDENFASYIADLRKIAIDCNFGTSLDRMLRYRLVCGLKDKALQRSLLSMSDLTLKIVQEKALACEAATRNLLEISHPEQIKFVKDQSYHKSVNRIMENDRPSTSATDVIQAERQTEEFLPSPKLNRGYAVIFNHETFKPSLNQEDRKGTAKDVQSLKNVFEYFRIDVIVKQDFTLNEINQEVFRLRNFDFNPYDCFLIVILSHGQQNNYLYAYDSDYNLNETIVNRIVNTNDTLIGKPKIFIIQACKGTRQPNTFIKNDANNTSNAIECPTLSDMFFAFSTYEGFVSKRDTRHGGIFIQTLCKTLQECGSTQSITSVMEHVTKELVTNNNLLGAQVPSVLTTLTLPFIFGDIGKVIKFIPTAVKTMYKGSFKYLKEELIVEIFSYLCLDDIIDASLVCKNWNNAFRNSKIQEKYLLVLKKTNFNEYQPNYGTRNFCNIKLDEITFETNIKNIKLIQQFARNLKFILFHRCTITENQVLSILQTTTNLQTLEIVDCDFNDSFRNKRKNYFNQDIRLNITSFKYYNESGINYIFCGNLLEIMPNIQNLSLMLCNNNESFFRQMNMAMMYPFTNVRRSLELKLVGKIRNLKLDKLCLLEILSPEIFLSIIAHQQSLKQLKIDKVYLNDDLIVICNKLSNLELLAINLGTSIGDKDFKDLWKLKQLKNLDVRAVNLTAEGIIDGLKEENNNLRSLRIHNLKPGENLLTHITSKFHHLRELELICESGVTVQDIQSIWRNLGWLKQLIIDCREMIAISDSAFTGRYFENTTQINGSSIADVKELQHLDLRLKINITASTLKEIAKLKELIFLRVNFSSSKIEVDDLNILTRCSLLEDIDITLARCFSDKKTNLLRKQFGRIKSFKIK